MEVMGTSLTGLSYCKGCKNNFHLVRGPAVVFWGGVQSILFT